MLNQAVQRGEIPAERNRPLIADTLTALGLMRIVNGQSVDAAVVREAIDTLILPAVGLVPPPDRRRAHLARFRSKPFGTSRSGQEVSPR